MESVDESKAIKEGNLVLVFIWLFCHYPLCYNPSLLNNARLFAMNSADGVPNLEIKHEDVIKWNMKVSFTLSNWCTCRAIAIKFKVVRLLVHVFSAMKVWSHVPPSEFKKKKKIRLQDCLCDYFWAKTIINTSQKPDDRVLHGWAYLTCLFCCTGLVSAYQSFAKILRFYMLWSVFLGLLRLFFFVHAHSTYRYTCKMPLS